jgi:hypothetical protein
VLPTRLWAEEFITAQNKNKYLPNITKGVEVHRFFGSNSAYNDLLREPECYLEDLCVADRMISEWILKKQSLRIWTGFI